MGLLERAKQDIERFTSDSDGFAAEITFTAPTGEILVTNGLHIKTTIAYDLDGNLINSRKASVSVSEKYFTDAGYPVRVNGEINLNKHKVDVKDSTGNTFNYMVKEFFPDETIGLITCTLNARNVS